MDDADRLLLAACELQHGLTTRSQARAFGLSADAVRWRVRRGDFDAEGPRVLSRPGVPPSKARPLMRAVLDAGLGAVLSHQTAAAWWGLPGFDLLRIHVTRPRGITGAPVVFAHHLHEVLDLSTDQVTVLHGIPIVRPERLAFELFATVHPLRAARATETAWSKGLLSGASMRRVFAELAGRGRDGTVATREFLEWHPDDWVPPASNQEARFISIIAGEVYGGWRRQIDLGADGWVGRVDFLHEWLPLVVEVQSQRYHAALLDRAADARRRAKLEAAGFIVVEVWDDWLWNDKDRVIQAVKAGYLLAAARYHLLHPDRPPANLHLDSV